jgi:antirestriction protein ArdC
MPLRPDIRYGGNRACYSPSLDYCNIPHQHTFDTIESFYDTVFHELSHSTGHANRLGRKGVTETSYFGSHEYSKEELVAERGAAFLCGHVGIENTTIENSAAYLQGWLKALKNDKTLLIHAAAQAQKASDFILNRNGGEEDYLTEDALKQ